MSPNSFSDRRKRSPENIEVIARAVIFDAEKKKILFCAPKDKKYFYLPGGHVEWRETALSALRREIEEELGLKLKADQFSFAGAGENIFVQNNQNRHEVNLYFRLSGSLPDVGVSSREAHITFAWIPIEEISKKDILPASVKQRCAIWSKTDSIGWQ